ncbi:MAG: mitofusin [Pycnora praestabilis]|nr:MAG: mitofusin [Pycnora praestabilis]
MSQDDQSGGRRNSSGGSSSDRPSTARSLTTPHQRPSGRPHYMTVGSGSTSANAAALTALLDDDSGYGGSIAGDGATGVGAGHGWHPGLTRDRPTPSHTPVRPGESNPASENERQVLATHIHQLYYNQRRVALGRSINRTVETLKDLQHMNSSWPAHYPSIRTQSNTPSRPDPRPGMVHTQSSAGEINHQIEPPLFRPGGPKRAGTSLGEGSSQAESSAVGERRPTPEPRLVTPQIAQEFSILKLDLKLGASSQTDIVHSLEKKSIASLLDGKISQSIRHLLSLRDRIEDTSSKVLVTGDLNAGKSTFCNALLRRKVLPEDQQPCTSIFCEVLDARENGGIEEVHAIHKDVQYNRNDESTYDVYALKDLEKIVIDNDRYTQCKVYVKDIRAVDESLLNNGVVDISIIDAPGLNMDSIKTTAVFARQEEIDVVVFVVSAANHFTLSAKEFIWNAAHEKAYIFIVVNGFDNIRDKERCQRMILEQVANLSPRTFKESAELVHFVSSNAIPVAPADAPSGSGGGGGGGGGGSDPFGDDAADDGNEDDEPKGKHGEPGSTSPKGKGKEKEKLQDFEDLEGSLRRFVLEKRARSKLAPAKTYLLNVLGDVNTLANVNQDIAQSELERVTKELQELEPVFEQSKKARAEVSEDIDRTIEETCTSVYSRTRSSLTTTIAEVSEQDLGVPYPGLMHAFQYGEDIKNAMLDQISAAVTSCEEYARDRSVQEVSNIKDLGTLHLGNEYTDFSFRSDMMFKRKRDVLARQVNTEVEVWDFFDAPTFWSQQEKVAGTGMAMTVVGVLGGRLVGGVGWIDGALGAARVLGSQNIKRLIIPGICFAGKPSSPETFLTIINSSTPVIATASYAVSSISTSLPRRLSAKLSADLLAIDYTHANAHRISSEVRKVLRYPANNLRVGLQQSFEKLSTQRSETNKVKQESEVARKYFGNLVRESGEITRGVEDVDLEGPAPGVAGGYDF